MMEIRFSVRRLDTGRKRRLPELQPMTMKDADLSEAQTMAAKVTDTLARKRNLGRRILYR